MKLRFPHPLTLLIGFIALVALLSYVLPAGQFERRDDPVTGRKVVVAGTYHSVPQQPVTPFQAVVAIPKGIADAVSVIALVFLVGGAFGVVDQTGALRRGVGWMVLRLKRRELLVIPICCIAFAAGGALENMQEEIIPLVPVLLLLTMRLGFDPLVAAAVSVGAAGVGSAFSPINPFQVGIAQKLAGLPLLSASGFRLVFLSMAFAGMLIGFARAIYVVAEQGQIIDTIVNGLFAPLSHLPVGVAAVGMMVVQLLVHFPVPSVSGQAVLTMPVLVPLSDLLGLSRQVTVLAYQYGGGLADIMVPTNGALMAILAASGVPYGKWIRFLAPVYAGLFLIGVVAVGVGILIGLS